MTRARELKFRAQSNRAKERSGGRHRVPIESSAETAHCTPVRKLLKPEEQNHMKGFRRTILKSSPEPGTVPIITCYSGKHNAWSNRLRIQESFASIVQ